MTTPTRSDRSWRRAIGVVLFVALVGPAIGGLMFPGPMYLTIMWSLILNNATESLPIVGAMLLGGYVVGMLPAFVAGLIMGFVTWRRGGIGYWGAAFAGACGVIFLVALIAFQSWQQEVPNTDPRYFLIVLAPTGIAAAIICRFLLARLRLLPSSRV